MKVSVLGAGAIGSMLGGLLQHADPQLEVLLVTRGEHGRVLAERGTVRLDGPWGTLDVPIASSTDVADIAGSDFVLVTVKSQATEEAARAAQPHWGEATIVSIQNGINEHVLSRYVAADKLVMGMTAINSALVEPGHLSLQLAGPVVLGPGVDGDPNAPIEAATRLLAKIDTPAIRVQSNPQTLGIRYNKLAINALGFASSMSASNFISEALAYGPWRNAVGLPLVGECAELFRRANIRLANIPGIPNLPKLTRFMRMMNAPALGRVVTFGARRLFDRKPIIFSAQQDIERKKPTEVDYVNGELVRLADSLGLAAPFNARVTEMVHELEERSDGTFFSRQEVIERFRALPKLANVA